MHIDIILYFFYRKFINGWHIFLIRQSDIYCFIVYFNNFADFPKS